MGGPWKVQFPQRAGGTGSPPQPATAKRNWVAVANNLRRRKNFCHGTQSDMPCAALGTLYTKNPPAQSQLAAENNLRAGIELGPSRDPVLLD